MLGQSSNMSMPTILLRRDGLGMYKCRPRNEEVDLSHRVKGIPLDSQNLETLREGQNRVLVAPKE